MRLLFLLLMLSASVPAAAVDTRDSSTTMVARAIEAAVRDRLGPEAAVTVESIDVRLEVSPDGIAAVPTPSVRIGYPSRFLLVRRGPRSRGDRVGEATATVRGAAPAVRTTAPIRRGDRLDAASVETIDMEGRLLRPLPTIDECRDARARRDLAAGVLITRADIVSEPLVRSGDTVETRVRIGEVTIAGPMIATETGRRGEVIRVVNQKTRRTVRAEVTGIREVEVVDVR
jgi:flagella basal body P-ring formation protein FlgA